MTPREIIFEKASQSPRSILLPEGEDRRIIQAAARAADEGLAEPILMGGEAAIRKIAGEIGADPGKIRVMPPPTAEKAEEYAEKYLALQKETGREAEIEKARETMRNPVYSAAMAVREEEADAMVAGAVNYSATVMRAAYRVIGLRKGIKRFSSFLLLSGLRADYGENGAFIFADPSVTPEPTVEQLAEISVTTAESTADLLGWEPRIALLSFSTKGSSGAEPAARIRKAASLACRMAPRLKIDGELQADAAIVPEIARLKGAESAVAGRANILIFPNLDSGNISYKLVQHLTGADCYGPILQGFAKPVNDLSRGATADDILGVICITSVQAQNSG